MASTSKIDLSKLSDADMRAYLQQLQDEMAIRATPSSTSVSASVVEIAKAVAEQAAEPTATPSTPAVAVPSPASSPLVAKDLNVELNLVPMVEKTASSPSNNNEEEENASMKELEKEISSKDAPLVPPSSSKKRKLAVLALSSQEVEEEEDGVQLVAFHKAPTAQSTPSKSVGEETAPPPLKSRLRSAGKTTARKGKGKAKAERSLSTSTVPNFAEGKKVLPPFIIRPSFFADHQVEEVLEMLKFQGWEHICSEGVSVNEVQVREFYHYFVLSKGDVLTGSSKVSGEDISFSPKVLSRLLNVPLGGFYEIPASEANEEKLACMERLFGSTEVELHTDQLTLMQRVAFYIVSRSVTPRQERRNTITLFDLSLLDRFLRKEKIDLPRVILCHMERCKAKSHSLAYPGLVKLLLQKEEVYDEANEVSLRYELESSTVEKLKFVGDSRGTGTVAAKKAAGEGTSKGGSIQHQILVELKKMNTTMSLLLDHFLSKADDSAEDPEI